MQQRQNERAAWDQETKIHWMESISEWSKQDCGKWNILEKRTKERKKDGKECEGKDCGKAHRVAWYYEIELLD